MHDLRQYLFYSYIVYGFFLPCVFIFLLFIYQTYSNFLSSLIIIDTILFLILLGILFRFRAEKRPLWSYILLIIVIILITMRNFYLFISIIYRTMTKFEQKKAIFLDAINRQISFIKEPHHPVWEIIISKQCCGLNSQGDTREYQWFTQTTFAYYCPNLYFEQNQIVKYEQNFKMTYSPQGPCLPLIYKVLKVELILTSIGFGFGVLLMLLTWSLLWQYRSSYLTLLENMARKKQKKTSTITTKSSSITSTIQEPESVEIPIAPVAEKLETSSQIITPKASETKRLYKGYLPSLEEMK